MPLTAINWHTRFLQQAAWTSSLRHYLYPRAGLATARRVLEVGCGSGVLLDELRQHAPHIHGLDIDAAHLNLAARGNTLLTRADAGQLPYASHSFEVTLCHFVLLWLPDPAQAVREMARVTRPGGSVLALAEPDYGGRIDFPAEFATLGTLQSTALRQQGADPCLGRKLAGIFQQAGLRQIESGVLGGQWAAEALTSLDWEGEWQVLENDLKQMSEGLSASDIAHWRERDRQARRRGERVLFVPTFWAWGKTA
jgi:ubiquinone/menaquinone biosynthesis C-methylase UbiE